jgi:hypothetical protein
VQRRPVVRPAIFGLDLAVGVAARAVQRELPRILSLSGELAAERLNMVIDFRA